MPSDEYIRDLENNRIFHSYGYDEGYKDGYAKGYEDSKVLDEIRAEIDSYGAIWVEYTITGHTDRDIEKIVQNVLGQAKEQVLDIIDKHRREEEG